MSRYDRSNPCLARIKERFPLTKSGSTKSTFHVALSLPGDFHYQPGDSIAILPSNNPEQVALALRALKASGDAILHDPKSGQQTTLRDYLMQKANLQKTNSSLLKSLQEKCYSAELAELLLPENKPQLTSFLEENGPIDLFHKCSSAAFAPEEIPKLFLPLLPRFYSVASSQLVFPREVHLTVAITRWQSKGKWIEGICSSFLCDRAEAESTPIPIYVQPAHGFRLPDPTASLILVGPGTGVAPYRAFLQERLAAKASGAHWLFFGERNRSTDFYYENFWLDLVRQGALRLDLAFSRDGQEKVYVQHRMWEQREQLWSWMQQGAYFYVCGDASRMAKDVEAMLQRIAADQDGLTEEEARRKIKALRAEKRYLTDVY